MNHRSDIRGTGSYLVAALKNQSSYWVTEINQERLRRGLTPIPVSGKSWDQLNETEKRNVKAAQVQDRLQDAREEARLLELQQKLARLKSEIGES
jgi:hypothetical protein